MPSLLSQTRRPSPLAMADPEQHKRETAPEAGGNRHAPRANTATSHHIQTAGRRAVVRRPCAVLRKPPRSPPASANANANARTRTPTRRSGRALWRLAFSGLASVLAWHWRRALFIRLLLICHVLLICLCPLRGAPHSRRLLLSLGSESSSLFPPLSGSTWSSPRFSFRCSQPTMLCFHSSKSQQPTARTGQKTSTAARLSFEAAPPSL